MWNVDNFLSSYINTKCEKKSSKLSFLVPATVNKSSRWNWDFLWYSVSANIFRIYELNDLLNAYIFKSLLSLFCSHWDNILSSLSRLSHLKLYLSGVFLKLLILLIHYSSSHIYTCLLYANYILKIKDIK